VTTRPEGQPPVTRTRRWLWPALLVLAWLVAGGAIGPFAGQLAEVQKNDNASFLPASAEATRVNELQRAFTESNVLPAVVVYERSAGITPADLDAVRADAAAFAELPTVAGDVPPPIPSRDGRAVQLIVPLDGDAGLEVSEAVADMRDRVQSRDGLTAHVTGPGGILADFGEAFGGIDGLLLVVALVVVFVILVAVYRSPILPFLVLATAGLALSAASAVIYLLADGDVIDLNGQSQGILFILVIGACTDYALLLVSRFREELHRQASRFDAMRVALRAVVEPIVASAGTVILGVLCLLFSDLNSNKGLGPVAALGIVASVAAALTFLPAALVLLGRAAFWPFRPAYEATPAQHNGVWARVAALVGRRPRAVWAATAIVLLGLAAFLPQLKADGVAQTDVFLNKVDSVTGQEVLGRHFPAGAGSPAVIIAKSGAENAVAAAAEGVDGVDSVTPTVRESGEPLVVNGLVQLNATLADPADGEAAIGTVQRLRAAVHAVEGADALVGGATAIQSDVQETSRRDQAVIIPIVLAVILVILILLLRSLVAPVLLVATVVLSFAATLGASALVFNHLFDFPGADPSTPLFGFIFLVALGVDYNIFLMTRVREESARLGTRDGVLTGLRVTGGVITSAGVVLAATFAALAVLPILFLAQIAFIVAFGVLLDTLVVRSLLVPAIAVELGRFTWWPGKLSRAAQAGE
jgi:RND superfamily putative drug exporter